MALHLKDLGNNITEEKNQRIFYSVIYSDPKTIEDAEVILKTAEIIDRTLLTPMERDELIRKVHSLKVDSIYYQVQIPSFIKDFGLIVFQLRPYLIDEFFSEVNSGNIKLEEHAFLSINYEKEIISINEMSDLGLCEFFLTDFAENNGIKVENFFDFFHLLILSEKSKEEGYEHRYKNPYLPTEFLTDEFIDKLCNKFKLERCALDEVWTHNFSDVYDRSWEENRRKLSKRDDLEESVKDREAHDLASDDRRNAREQYGITLLKKSWEAEYNLYKSSRAAQKSPNLIRSLVQGILRKKR